MKNLASACLALAALGLGFGPAALAAPVAVPIVATDQAGYEPGDTVTVTGSGFGPGEAVALQATGSTNATVLTAKTPADAAGAFSAALTLPLVYEETYSLTATGATSGSSASVVFDDDVNSLTVQTPSAPITVHPGDRASFVAMAKTSKGFGIAGVAITWSATGGAVSPPQSTTCGSDKVPCTGTLKPGQAATTYTAGTVTANFDVTATCCPVQTNPKGPLSSSQRVDVRAATSLSAAPVTGTFGSTMSLSATLQSGTGPLSGKAIAFTLNNAPVGIAATNDQGLATLTGVSLAGIGAGTYAGGVGATFAKEAAPASALATVVFYDASSATADLTVKATPTVTVTFSPPSPVTYDGTQHVPVVTVTGLGGVVLGEGDGKVAITYTKDLVAVTGVPTDAGKYTASAYFTSTNPSYTNADGITSFVILKADQNITFTPIPFKVFGDAPFSADASSKLAVSIAATGSCTASGLSVTLTGTGKDTCTLTASQPGNDNFNAAANVTQTFNVYSGLAQCISGGVATVIPNATVTLRVGTIVLATASADANGGYYLPPLAATRTYLVAYRGTIGGKTLVCGSNLVADATGAGGAAPPTPTSYTDPGNVVWTRAIPLTNAVVRPDDRITRPHQSRWYKIAICPGCKIRVTLSQLPANYELVLYDDLAKRYTALTTANLPATLDDVRHLNTSVIDDEASLIDDEASLIDDEASLIDDEASLIDDEASLIDDEASLIDDEASLIGDEAAKIFSSAAKQGRLAISAHSGRTDELIVRSVGSRSGDFYIRVVSPRDENDPANPFKISASIVPGSCTGADLTKTTSSLTPAGGTPRSLVLTHTGRLLKRDGTHLTTDEAKAFLALLNTFVSKAGGGTVVDLAADAGINSNYRNWDAARDCAPGANVVAESIEDLIAKYRGAMPGSSIEYVNIVGGANVIPYRLLTLREEVGTETLWQPPVLGGTATRAALNAGTTPTDDCYAARGRTAIFGREICISDGTKVSRAVEFKEDIEALASAFIASDGVARPSSALVTGYQFLADLAHSVAGQLRAGGSSGITVDDTLIEEMGLGPAHPTAWSADKLRDKLFRALPQGETQAYGIIDLEAHFSSNRLLAADYLSRLWATEINGTSDGRFSNVLVISPGCHAGRPILRPEGIPGVTDDVDFAQAFNAQGGTLVASTTYYYGGTYTVAYGERLIDNVFRSLRRGEGPRSIGQAVFEGKRDYMAQLTSASGIDLKVIASMTVYGFAQMGFDLPAANRIPDTTTASVAVTGGPGFATRDVDRGFALHRNDVPVTTFDGTTATESFFDVAGLTADQPLRPRLPLAVENAHADGYVARGFLFREGDYTDVLGFRPLPSGVATELAGPISSPIIKHFQPSLPVVLNDFASESLMFLPMQFRSDGFSPIGTARTYGRISGTVLYSSATGSAAIGAPPTIVGTRLAVATDGSGVLVTIVVAGPTGQPLADIQEVLATYTGTAGTFAGHWRSLSSLTGGLAAGPTTVVAGGEFVREYTGVITTSGTGAAPADVLVFSQAANGLGLASRDLGGGSYYRVPAPAPAAANPPIQPTVTLSAPEKVVYADRLHLEATVTDPSTGKKIAGTTVVFSVAGRTVIATTGATGTATEGVATADVLARTEPGSYTAAAAVPGDGVAIVGAGAARDVTITPAAASFTGVGATIQYSDDAPVATLSWGHGVITQVPVIIDLGKAGAVASLTDTSGHVTLSTLDFNGLAPGTYPGTLTYLGSTRFSAATTDVTVTVIREDGTVSLTSPLAQASHDVTLSADVTQQSDRSAGDWARGTVEYTLTPIGKRAGQAATSVTLPITGVDRLDGTSDGTTPVGLVDGRYALSAGLGGSYTSPAFTGELVVDTIPPTTTAAQIPAANAAGWTNALSVTVKLTAVDNDDGSGVKEIHYTIGGGVETVVQGSSASVTVTSEGITSIWFFAVDALGNKETAKSTDVRIDRTSPKTTATADRVPDSIGWYNHALRVAFSATDEAPATGIVPSGVASCSSAVDYAVPDSATASVTGSCTDKADNVGKATLAFKFDATPPSIKFVAPTTGTEWAFVLAQGVAPSAFFDCSDATSGVASCVATIKDAAGATVATVASGATTNLPTSAVGRYPVTVDSVDVAGNRSQATTTYVVRYDVCLLYDPTKAVNGGATAPIKIQLCDAAKKNVSSASTVAHATAVTQTTTNVPGAVIDAGGANPANNFRFLNATTGTAPSYIFDLKTVTASGAPLAMGTYGLAFTASGDPTTHVVTFEVK